MMGRLTHFMISPSDRHPLRCAAIVLLLGTLLTLRAIAQAEPAIPSEPASTGVAPVEATRAETTEVHVEPVVAGMPESAEDSSLTRRDSASAVAEDAPESIDSVHAVEPPRLTPPEYRYAGGPRYTMNGKLPYRETNIQPATLATFGGALLALAGTITWYQQAWYPDSTKAPFHFQTDWGYSKQFDKAGHMYGGWMSSYCSYEAFIASGLDQEDAAFWGMLGGLFFQTVMEVEDGFFSYGFDPTDALSNAIGAGYFYAQQRVPVLQYFNPKWSFGPNPRDSAREASQIRSRIIVDDYDRQDVWLSAKVHYLLPESLQPYWPKWLCLAVGAGARDVELRGYQPYREVHIALDYDLIEMLPDLGSFGNWLVQGLNNFKLLPAPALQVWPHVAFKLVYPFSL
jgi:hypothetical protein